MGLLRSDDRAPSSYQGPRLDGHWRCLSGPCDAGSPVGPFIGWCEVVFAALGFCTLRVFYSMFG